MSECKHCNGHGGAFIGHAPKPRWYPCVVCNREEPVDPKDATITRLTSEVATLQSYKALHQSLTAELERARKYESEHDTLQNVIGNQHELLEKQKAELERVRKELDNLVIDIVTAASEDVANSSTVVRVVSNVRKDRDALAADRKALRAELLSLRNDAGREISELSMLATNIERRAEEAESARDALRAEVERRSDVWAKVLKVMVDVDNPERGEEQCAICGDDYTTDHGKDDTGFCHNCASSTLDDLVNSARSALAPAPQAQEGGECETDRP